jgi:hypothetical protein
MKNFKYENLHKAKKLLGISYLGSVNLTAKHAKAFNYDELVYTLYLSPANTSGYEVCPKRTKECTVACLHESGYNRIDVKENKINNSRIVKTKLFFENREFFMSILIDEIKSTYLKALNQDYTFSIRLNNVSDINPERFRTRNLNILEIFPEVQFFDYTKVLSRIKLLEKYPNYDLTFSYSGENWDECLEALKNNVRVAVVFKDKIPEEYRGIQVINGDDYDMRYKDPKNVLVGLKFKKVRSKIDFSNNSFVVSL